MCIGWDQIKWYGWSGEDLGDDKQFFIQEATNDGRVFFFYKKLNYEMIMTCTLYGDLLKRSETTLPRFWSEKVAAPDRVS